MARRPGSRSENPSPTVGRGVHSGSCVGPCAYAASMNVGSAFGSGTSVIVASVSSSTPAVDTAFSSASGATFVGSMMPASTRSSASRSPCDRSQQSACQHRHRRCGSRRSPRRDATRSQGDYSGQRPENSRPAPPAGRSRTGHRLSGTAVVSTGSTATRIDRGGHRGKRDEVRGRRRPLGSVFGTAAGMRVDRPTNCRVGPRPGGGPSPPGCADSARKRPSSCGILRWFTASVP